MGDDAERVRRAWSRIDAWTKAKAKRVAKALRGGATDAAIAGAEARLGVKLSEDARESYRVHDGAQESDLFPSSLPDDMGYSLMSLEELRVIGPGRVAVATNGAGDYQCVDVHDGRVVEVLHETGEVKELAKGWAERLEELADGLEGKRYKYDAENGIVRPAPPDPMKAIREARRIIEEEAARGVTAPTSRTPGIEYEDVIGPLTAAGFGPASDARLTALARLGVSAAAGEFFRYFEPQGVREYRGFTFYPVPEVIGRNADHWVDGKEFPLVIAMTPEGGRVCIDPVWNPMDPPVVVYPAGVEMKGRTKKQLEKAGTRISRHLLEFLRKLVAGELGDAAKA